jgi:hypothetical protein
MSDSHLSPFTSQGDEHVDSMVEIRLDGQLDARWADWFDGMTLVPHDDGTTTLVGPVADQAALQGLLRRVGDLGMTLISVNAHG